MIGRTISHYRIVEKIGQGGMGVVYKAQDLRLDRLVALKFLPSHLEADQETRKRFVHEAKAASALDHPNIITVYDIDQAPDGRMFIATAYYPGESLKDRLARGPVELEDAIDILRQIGKGLQRAHEKGIIHRDIKPANILITRDNLVKIVDFGLAKLAAGSKVTKTGATVGTASYMSPEQARGEEVDHRSDIFSLGAVFYEMLAGERPFPGENEAAVTYRIVNEDPRPIADHRRDLPQWVERVLGRMLQKAREERYATISDVLDDISRFTVGPGSPRRTRRAWHATSLGLVAGAAAVLLVMLGWWFREHSGSGSLSLPARLSEVPAEFVVAVAPFYGIDDEGRNEGRVMQALVERALRDQIGSEEGVLIVARTIEKAPETPDEARSLGQATRASIVIWGGVLGLRKEVEIQPYLTVVNSGDGRSFVEPRTMAENGLGHSLVVDLDERDQLHMRRMKADELGKLATLAAACFYRNRDIEKALKILGGIAPPLSEAEQLKGQILADDRRWDEARAAYEAVDRIAPESPWPLVGLAGLQRRAGDHRGAVETLKKAISRDPQDARVHYYLGSAYADASDYDAARREFETARAIDPKDVWPLIGLGNILVREQRYADAVAAYEKAAETDPSDPWSHVALAEAYRYSSKPEERKRAYEKAVALAPDFVAALSQLARCYRDEERYDDAVVLLRRCLALEPLNAAARVELSQVYEIQGKLEPAREEVERAISLRSNDPWPRQALAYFHENRGDTASAIREFERAISLLTDETAFSARIGLGGIHLAQGRIEEAEELFREAAGKDSDGGFVNFFVGNQFLFHGHYERAIEIYRHVLTESPEWSVVHVFAGWAYEETNRLQESVDAYGKAVATADASSLSSVDSLESVLYSFPYYVALCRAGRPREAIARMEFLCDSLHSFLSREEQVFTAKLVDFLAGRVPEKELWKATSSRNPREEKHNRIIAGYYTGMAYRIGFPVRLTRQAPDEQEARRHLEKVLTIRLPDSDVIEERERAALVLKRLRAHG